MTTIFTKLCIYIRIVIVVVIMNTTQVLFMYKQAGHPLDDLDSFMPTKCIFMSCQKEAIKWSDLKAFIGLSLN